MGKYVSSTGLAYFLGKIKEIFAAKTHTHAAGDITSGTFNSARLPTVPVTKGGTGATTAQNARTNLGITTLNDSDFVTYVKSGIQ